MEEKPIHREKLENLMTKSKELERNNFLPQEENDRIYFAVALLYIETPHTDVFARRRLNALADTHTVKMRIEPDATCG